MGDAATAELKSKYPNVQIQVQGSTTLQDQVAKAQAMITSGVNALGLEPIAGPGVLPLLQQAKSAHIPVFLVEDSATGAVQNGLAVTYIAADETHGGQLVGQAMSKALGGSGDVAIVQGAAGDTVANERTAGFMSGIKGTNLKVVSSVPGDWTRDTALKVTSDILTANPNLKGIFAENDEMAFGVNDAIQAAHKTGKIFVAGYNGTCTGLQATLQKKFQLDGVLYLGLIGKRFADDTLAYLGGAKVPPREVMPIAALTSSQLQGVRTGALTNVPGATDLRSRLETAWTGHC